MRCKVVLIFVSCVWDKIIWKEIINSILLVMYFCLLSVNLFCGFIINDLVFIVNDWVLNILLFFIVIVFLW